jgi:hypothetical protein
MALSLLEVKARPTNNDLQGQIVEVHECLNMVGDQVGKHGDQLKMQGLQIALICRAMGISIPEGYLIEPPLEHLPVLEKSVGRRVAGLKPWQAGFGLGGVIMGALSLYKVFEPALVSFALTLHHQLMAFHG